MSVDLPTLRGLVTVVLLVAFLGMVVWAWSSKRKTDFEEAAQLPLDEDSAPAKSNSSQEA
ncbi:MAG: cbb3-type cytochrome oxidase subunit 3 [Gammaproteobacteria bacterium]